MRNCMILGAGRSGTSLAAGCLASAGYHMGDDLIEPCETNPQGFFECRRINALNEDILRAVDARGAPRYLGLFGRQRLRHDQYWLACLSPRTTFRPDPAIRERIRDCLSRRPYCFKDPRFCYTLPVWQPELGRAAFLCVFRHPGATVRSTLRECERMDYLGDVHMTERWAWQLWTCMYRAVLAMPDRDRTWLFVHYNQILEGDAFSRVAEHLDVTIQSDFVNPALSRTPTMPITSSSVARLYDALCERAGYDRSRDR
ncbi:MAG: hypothetical protein HN919_16095 [Verrucomicrobia bacterium]|jgi:hypothetical protein|nr:hypothetical protein [Verrucomicrobiota bacterium]MBT7067821.1 hypothetical protein [Verrucomicrobiota bacterium]MBT7701965.1 hypothetical protein [Verrucomicrobiota bacterium]